MGLRVILSYLLVCYLFFYCKWVEGYRELSKEENLELDEQLKLMNKPAVKTIKTKYGDLYDCVDFYKQPAFDHPLLKNHNFHPQMRSTSSRRVSSENEVPKLNYKQVDVRLEGGGCPVGTVPIRRTTKDDLIRAKFHSEMHASKINPLTKEQPGTHFALARTRENINYDGVGAIISLWNIPATAPQYTSGRIKIRNGAESMEAGWTVNPGLYGDSRSYMYIFTNAGQSHCFNARCGYVHLNKDIPVDMVLDPVSSFGKEQFAITLSIYQDVNTKDWFLKYNDSRIDIGFWPAKIFTNLGNTATQAEWGGEVFSPPNVPAPGMGSGHELIEGMEDTTKDAFFGNTNIKVNNAIMNPPFNLDLFIDVVNYNVINERDVGGDIKYLIVYGGVGGATGD